MRPADEQPAEQTRGVARMAAMGLRLGSRAVDSGFFVVVAFGLHRRRGFRSEGAAMVGNLRSPANP